MTIRVLPPRKMIYELVCGGCEHVLQFEESDRRGYEWTEDAPEGGQRVVNDFHVICPNCATRNHFADAVRVQAPA